MLYKNEIYRLYLELIEKKEKTKNDKLTNVFSTYAIIAVVVMNLISS